MGVVLPTHRELNWPTPESSPTFSVSVRFATVALASAYAWSHVPVSCQPAVRKEGDEERSTQCEATNGCEGQEGKDEHKEHR
jgi:hypothetical protein